MHVQDRRIRPPVVEDDESEPELGRVDLVLVRELGDDGGTDSGSVFRSRSRRETRCTDCRMGVQGFELLVFAQSCDDLVCGVERIVQLGELLDQPGAALEQLRELLDG